MTHVGAPPHPTRLDTEMVLPLDTTSLHIRPGGEVPSVEVCVFDNGHNSLYNLIGMSRYTLSEVIALGLRAAVNGTANSDMHVRLLLVDSWSGKGSGLNGADEMVDSGGLDATFKYQVRSGEERKTRGAGYRSNFTNTSFFAPLFAHRSTWPHQTPLSRAAGLATRRP